MITGENRVEGIKGHFNNLFPVAWLLCHRVKCRKGLRVLGADVSGSSSWQITVDMNQKRRSATVTASTSAVDADKRAQRLLLWLFHKWTVYHHDVHLFEEYQFGFIGRICFCSF